MADSTPTNHAQYLEQIKQFRESRNFEEALQLIKIAVDEGRATWETYWELALIAKEQNKVALVDKASAIVQSLNPDFWFARELPKHVRGYYSQLEQDKIIERFFAEHPPKNKVFVEVGAFDGVHYSNVRRLQETYGWSGVSIEPVGKNYDKLCKSYFDKPVVCIRCAVGAHEGMAEINVSSYPHLRDWGSDVATLSESETQRWQDLYGAVWHKERIPVKTLTAVLNENRIDSFDFLSIDAEGHDLEVLLGLDFSAYKPQLIVVEYNKNRQQIHDLLIDNGYRLYHDNNQDLFMELVNTPPNQRVSTPITIPTSPQLAEVLSTFELQTRINKTVSCHDCDDIPKVTNAGQVIAGNPPCQLMHNGIKIVHKAFHGEWMSEIIKRLQGHHEPQEEKLFHEVLKTIPANAVMVELGSFWSYYSMWFNKAVVNAKNYMIEPNPEKFELGRQHFQLNNMQGNFTRAFIGQMSQASSTFKDWDNKVYTLPQVSIDDFMITNGIEFLHLLHSDIQGAEYEMLLGCQRAIANHKIGYVFISTHGTCHEKCLFFLQQHRFTIIASHTIAESYSADGLIVAASPAVQSIPPVRISRFGVDQLEANNQPQLKQILDKLNPHLLALGILPLDKKIRCATVPPIKLLTCSRFDIVPKYIYAKHRETGIDSSWASECYAAHINAFNGFQEGDGSGKSGIEKFIAAFDTLLDSIKEVGFSPYQSLIPLDRDGTVIDGAHRVAACLLHNRQIDTVRFEMATNNYNFEYFLQRGFAPDFCDAIALEYCRLNPQAYIVSIFPSAIGREHEVRSLLSRYVTVFYAKEVQLSRLGSVNLVRQMYDGEKWVGNFNTQFDGAQHKAAECFRNDGPVRVYVVTADDMEKVKSLKLQIRDLFGISNHSVHINDTHEETIRLARLLLNANSIHFLNNAQLITFPAFQAHLENYKKILRERDVDVECLCIDGSSVMAAYGIREARDLDYLHFGYDDLRFDYPPELIGSHNTEIGHHVTTRDDIIFNPNNHFYYDGVKFASLGIIRAMKQKRGEQKDFTDISLIDRFVSTPPIAPHVYAGGNATPQKDSSGNTRPPKIVGLVPARNEKQIIAQCLRALAMFTDAIVYLDDASTDETPQIVESLATECRIERIIRKQEWCRDEPGDRNAMLKAGREIGATHFIIIDADEMLTSNMLGTEGLRKAILQLQPGDQIALNWIQLWRSIEQYRFDQSVWTNNYKSIIFCDDGKCSYSSEFIHTPRVPVNLSGRHFTIQGYESGLLHFQFVNWRNLLLKQAWYRCLEHIREPGKPVEEINKRYAPSKDEIGLGLAPSQAQWFAGYPFFNRQVYDHPDEWRQEQILGWFKEYGRGYFAGLDIGDVPLHDSPTPVTSDTWLTKDLSIKPAPNNMIEVNGVLGYLNLGDIDFLRRFVAKIKPGSTIVEIGSFLGLSSLVIARELHLRGDTATKLYCVDSWQKASTSYQHAEKGGFRQDFFRTFLENIQKSGLSSYITPMNSDSSAAAAKFVDQSIDFLFVDGDHSFGGCYSDLHSWFNKVNPSGILIGHDCTPDGGVRQAVEKFCAEYNLDFLVHEPPYCHYMYEIIRKKTLNPDNNNSLWGVAERESDKKQTVFPESKLAHQLLDGLKGLEIGASAHNPFGLNTRNVGLRIGGYIQEQVNFCGYAVEIDIEAPAHAIPVPNETEDFIISSHVVEHCPDLIRSLQEWFRIVRPEGYLFMIVPHRNASSADVGRPLTEWAHVCEDFRNNVAATTETDPKIFANHHCHVFAPETLKQFIGTIFGDRLKLVAEQQYDDKVGNGFTLAYRKACSLAAAFPWHVPASDGSIFALPQLADRNDLHYRVTAIVSTYKSEAFIRGCLDDLVQQTLYQRGELEIIVIDSASPENEGAIVREFQRHFPHIKYQRTPERETIYQAWNRGIKGALGNYITNANTDDCHRRDALEIMAQALDSHPDVAIVYGDVFVTNFPYQTFTHHIRSGYHCRPDYVPEIMLSGCHMGPQPMWRKSIHDQVGYFDEMLQSAGDYEFWCRCALQAPLLHIPAFLGLYYENPIGFCNADTNLSSRETLSIKQAYSGKFPVPSKNFIFNLQFSGIVEPGCFVNICMITYNRLEFTQRALNALLLKTSFPYVITVVDNASSDGTREYLQLQQQRGVIKNLVLLDENVGISKASNLAWDLEPEAKYYLKLDNDIVIQKAGWLEKMVQAIESIPEAGAVAYNFEPATYPLEVCHGLPVRPKREGNLGGACILIPQRTHVRLGFWCEDYGLYGEEDQDYGERILAANLLNIYMEDEAIGLHLPAGRAAKIDLDDYTAHDGQEETIHSSYRDSKDASRKRNHSSGIIDSNIKFYHDNETHLYVPSQFAAGLRIAPNISRNQQPVTGKIKVGVFSFDAQEHGCGYYRLASPLTANPESIELIWGIEFQEDFNCRIIPEVALQVDIIVVQRFFVRRETAGFIEYLLTIGKPVIYETDDLITDIPSTNSNFDWGNATTSYLTEFIRRCSAVTVSTRELRNHFSHFNDNIYVLRNQLDEKLWQPNPPVVHKPIIIGYAGTATHVADLQILEPVLDAVAKKYGSSVSFTFMGCATENLSKLPGYTYIPFETTYTAYAQILQGTPIDIMLIPLADTPFNRCKSNIKWLEYSACGIIGIYSDLPPYNSCIVQGETGILVDANPEHWFQAISLLVENEWLRLAIARQAQAEVLTAHTLRAGAHHWLKVYQEILEQHRSSAARSPDVSIVIPVYDQINLTCQCLDALKHTVPPSISAEIIVIDNGSSDETQMVLSQHPLKPTILTNSENLGFSRACNQGAKAARANIILFLNNDTIAKPGWLEPLLQALNTNEADICGARLLYPDGRCQHAGIAFNNRGLGYHIFANFPGDAPPVKERRQMQAVTGACMALRKSLFLELGGFEEEYRNGFEDVDLCLRAQEQGKRILYVPESTVIHFAEQSAGRKSHDVPNMQRFFSRWQGKIRSDDQEFYLRFGLASRVETDGRIIVTPLAGAAPKVSIIIPLFNKVNLTRNCLKTLELQTPAGMYELVLVDNGSTDETGSLLDEWQGKARIVRNRSNLGFAAACNQGARIAQGKFLLFLNNDTEVTSQWLQPLVEVLDHDPAVAAVGSKLIFPDNTIQHAGVIIVEDHLTGDLLLAKNNFIGLPTSHPPANIPMYMQALTAACILIRKNAFDEAGGFDEGYWNGYEDVDLCFTLGKNSWHVIYQPSSVVLHFESQSGPERFKRAPQNIQRLHAKWLGIIKPDVVIPSPTSKSEKAGLGANIIRPYQLPSQPLTASTSDLRYPLVPLVGQSATSPLQRLASSTRLKSILNRYTTE